MLEEKIKSEAANLGFFIMRLVPMSRCVALK
jgi:hypothetical protein